MNLLADHELIGLFAASPNHEPLFSGIDPSRPLGRDCQIQPSSIDLTIGQIFLPEAKRDARGSLERPLTNWTLKPGQTAVIVTKERADFPANISAFAFPPTRISTAGILMTNPGHIDPGFVGHLSFTVINMSKQDYLLNAGEVVVTCLVVRLSSDVKLSYSQQGHQPVGPQPRVETLESLSRDFLDIERRAGRQAREVTSQKFRQYSVIGAIVAVAGLAVPTWFALLQPLMETSNKVAKLEEQLSSISPPQGPDIKVAMASLAAELSSLSSRALEERTEARTTLVELTSRLQALSDALQLHATETELKFKDLQQAIEKSE